MDLLDELYEYLEDQSGRLRTLDRTLAPVYARDQELRLLVKQTHHCGRARAPAPDDHRPRTPNDMIGVYKLNRSATAMMERRDLLIELDRLAFVYGPQREQRRLLAASVKATKKRINALQDYERRRREREEA